MIRPQKERAEETSGNVKMTWKLATALLLPAAFYGVVIDMTEEDVIVEFGNNKKLPYSNEKTGNR